MKRRTIVLGANAALRVKGGALEIEHGPAAERIKLRVDIDDAPPLAILFDGRGEFLTGEAIRFCVARGVVIALPDGPGRMATIIASALEAKDGETLRDTGPALIRAQCAADPVAVARAIVRAKIEADACAIGPRLDPRRNASASVGGSSRPDGAWRVSYNCRVAIDDGQQSKRRGFDAERYQAQIEAAHSVAEIVAIEARAANVYWRSWRDVGLIERKGGNLPRSWRRFAQRNKGAEFLGNKHAAHPVNAMLNYCVVVEAGRLARGLSAAGFALSIGFLHADRHGRNSLVWDCIEPLRAKIATRVFAYIAAREFARADFPAAGVGVRRIARPVIAEILDRCLLPQEDIDDAVAWLAGLVMDCAPTRPMRRGRPASRTALGLH